MNKTIFGSNREKKKVKVFENDSNTEVLVSEYRHFITIFESIGFYHAVCNLEV